MDAAADLQRAKRAFVRRRNQIKRAKKDVNAFIEFCSVVEGGKRGRQDAVHVEWQRIWSECDRAIILAPVGHGKSTQLIWRLIWELGRDPNLQIAIVSATQGHPKNLLGSIKQEIEENPRVRMVFPKLKRAKGTREVWSSTEILIDRPSRDPNPSIKVFGLHGKILGSRAHIMVLDDICNMENTISDLQREKAKQWVRGEVIGRLKARSRVWAVGHIWHEEDTLQVLREIKGWRYFRYEYMVPKGTIEKAANGGGYVIADAVAEATAEEKDQPHEGDDTLREDREPLAPGVLDLEALQEKREELGPIYEKMMLKNRLPADTEGRFRRDWFTNCLKLGKGQDFLPAWNPSSAPTYTGVDLGVKKKPGADFTVLFTVALLPSGHRQVIDIRSGRWKAPEILDEIRDVYAKFGSIIAVENNAAQNYLLDFAEHLETLPIRDHHTSASNKFDMAHGIESLGLELRQQKWILPSTDESDPRGALIPPTEMAKAISGAMGYDPRRHPSDHLMAWWICREAIRLSPAATAWFEAPDSDHMLR